MSEQTTLIMDCLACQPGCIWPVDGATDIGISVAQFFAQACVNCIELNITYNPTFVSQSIGPGQNTCIYEQDHPAGSPCGVAKMRLVVSLTIPFGFTFLQCILLDILGFQFAKWEKTLTPAEALTNGPFEMEPKSISFALCTQIFTIPVVLFAV